MKDETMGQEDAAQDGEACAEVLESLDQIALAEIAFDDSSVDVQDETEIEAQPDDQDAKTMVPRPPKTGRGTRIPNARPTTSPNPIRARKPSCSTAYRPRIR